MGLKITRNANAARRERKSLQSTGLSAEELDSLMSARHAYRPTASDDSRRGHPSIVEKVFPDSDGRLQSQSIGELFDRVWELVRRNRNADIVLDMSEITSLASRFARELAFLRRHLTGQNRRVLLSGVRPECSFLLDIG